MVAFNLARTDRAVGQSPRDLGGAFLGQLIFVAGRLNPWRLFHRLRDEAWQNETIHELNLLSDHYLDDVGIKRRIDLRADDLVKRLRAGG
jgi:hypothetical protein